MADDPNQQGSSERRPFAPVVLSGMRPTGALHLGHYFGAIENWVRLQNDGGYELLFMSADWHALTTGYQQPPDIAALRVEMVADWMACGIDPSKSTLFGQADVLEHAELATLLQMITPIPWLERVPTYKEQQKELSDKDLSTAGFLSYPVLQTADIAVYQGTHVPVGEDQLAHVELSRQVLRRFNKLYGVVFPEPKGLVTEVKRLAGLDGRKMSKSYHNAIYLSDDHDALKSKVMPAPTDPARVKRTDPGNPDICTIFDYQKLVQPQALLAEIDEGCRTAGIGCVQCKKQLISRLDEYLEPIRSRRLDILDQGLASDVLATGREVARKKASATMLEVREAMRL